MSSCEQIEIHFEDHQQKLRKWCYPLKEDAFMSRESSPQIDKIFGAGSSLFSPLLFGKFFDPSDAFPLWEFDSDSLLQGSGQQQRQHKVDWFQTDAEYVLKAELAEPSNNIILQVCLENGKILEINVRPRMKPHHHQHHHKSTMDNDNWKSSRNWWEHGHVRRIELPPNDQTDWRRTEAYVKNGVFLEIKIPKTSASASASAPPP